MKYEIMVAGIAASRLWYRLTSFASGSKYRRFAALVVMRITG